MHATDTRVIAVVQFVIRHSVLYVVAPHFCARPVGEWAELNQIEFCIPINLANAGTLGGLRAANGRDPGIEGRELPPQRFNFTNGAALVRIACPEPRPEFLLLFFGRQLGIELLNLDSVALFHAIDQVVGLWKQKFCIAGKDLYVRIDPERNIEQRDALNAHSGRQGDVFAKSGERPRQYLLGIPAFSNSVDVLKIGFHLALSAEFGFTAEKSFNSRLLNFALRRAASARRTTSPTTSSRGAARLGESVSSCTVVT